jgi:putative transposase
VAHKLRDASAGIFHVYTHCVWVSPGHYRDDVDRLDFLRRLARVTADFEFKCIGFCLMTTHYHLILEVGDGVLPAAMQKLNHGYACEFNRRYGLRGHVQFRRYGSRRICDETDLVNTYAYVMNNPREAGLCVKASLWPWSSYAGTIGLRRPHSFVDDGRILRCFSLEPDARAALRRAVGES